MLSMLEIVDIKEELLKHEILEYIKMLFETLVPLANSVIEIKFPDNFETKINFVSDRWKSPFPH